MKKIEKIAIGVVRVVSIVMLTILFTYSIFNTTFLLDATEYSFFLEDSALAHVLIILITAVALVGIRILFKKVQIKVRESWIRVLLLISFLIGMGWILISQAEPIGDSKTIFNVAEQLHNGELSHFEKGAYMYMCPNQKGIVLFCYLLQMIVGKHNYLFFQFLNVCALVVSQWFIYKLVCLFTKDDKLSAIVLFTEVFFLPAIIYTSFTYGTLLGFAAATASVWWTCCFFEKKQVWYMLLAAIAMAFSVWIKSNNLICLIGIVLISIVQICREFEWKKVFFPVLLVGSYLLVMQSTDEIMNQLTNGLTKENAFVASAYIEMGLQESNRAPGWFNGYAYEICQINDLDADKYKEAINNDLKHSITNFVSNPSYAYEFFSKKIISQWSEPTFQSMWIVLVRESMLEETPRLKYWLVGPYSGANILIRQMLNYFQSIIYLGALVYVIVAKRESILKWLGVIIIIGGFLFHVIWEAKSQYIINYFMMLIPYGVIGIYYVIESILMLVKTEQRRMLIERYRADSGCKIRGVITIILVVATTLFILINGASFANEEDILYYNYIMWFG